MNRQIVSAVFDNRGEAERALSELRAAGVRDSDVSVVARDEGETGGHTHEHHDDAADHTRTGLGVGLGAGALLGFGALLIPGIGPFIAGGALAEALGVTGGAIATGAAVGGAAGGLAGALRDFGVSHEDSDYYEDRINRGGIFLAVDARDSRIGEEGVREILYRAGGHNASQARSTAM